MIKKALLPLILFICQIHFSQVEKDIHKLNSIKDLLTIEVKKIIDLNVKNDETVFLGEAVHYSGSDFLAKTEFVKYLVTKHGYKDIAFESDFFALLFNHDKKNLYTMWYKSNQCKELFDFLEKNNVTIWGFDNKINTIYSHQNFSKKLSEILSINGVILDKEFTRLTKNLMVYQYKSRKKLTNKEVNFLKTYTNQLLENNTILSNVLWTQILNSLKSAIELYTVKDNNSDKKRIPIRDKQMAKNLDFLVKDNPDKKFLVWIANGHMSKSNEDWMMGQTMGYQFRELNPNTTYHIAFGSMRLPPRDEKDIQKALKSDKTILSLLPSIENNYFIDANQIVNKKEEIKYLEINDLNIFNNLSKKSKLFAHFDALVFIANGEEVTLDK
ncbi:erythromycin esterase family protein [Lacinutrix sp.]|uniref:erythromycin esterase family protein n=1 Tax=Lacinutrix sp. TaxID=1937692 RepID=UPI0035C7EFE7